MSDQLKKLPKTLQEAIIFFSDPARALDCAISLRWPDGKITCPRCGSDRHSFISTRRIWFCKGCKKQFTVKVGTIFEDSPLGMDKWMTAVWLVVNCKNGISSYEVARDLGISQKSAWFMMHRIRKAMQSESLVKLGGKGKVVEVDESFIGGLSRNMHKQVRERRIKGTGGKDKTPVLGILERGGKVRASVIPNRRKKVVQTAVRENVTVGSALFTDALPSYNDLERDYAHKIVDHAVAYVNGNVHTNNLENFWSLLKRGIKGTYVSVEPFHLFRYLDEQSFRYNNRKDMNDAERFQTVMGNVFGNRLNWKQLTGKTPYATTN